MNDIHIDEVAVYYQIMVLMKQKSTVDISVATKFIIQATYTDRIHLGNSIFKPFSGLIQYCFFILVETKGETSNKTLFEVHR